MPEADNKGAISELNIIDNYRLFIEKQADLPKRKKVVISLSLNEI